MEPHGIWSSWSLVSSPLSGQALYVFPYTICQLLLTLFKALPAMIVVFGLHIIPEKLQTCNSQSHRQIDREFPGLCIWTELSSIFQRPSLDTRVRTQTISSPHFKTTNRYSLALVYIFIGKFTLAYIAMVCFSSQADKNQLTSSVHLSCHWYPNFSRHTFSISTSSILTINWQT